MRKASIGKILMALSIACVYIYLFGIVQVISVSADTEAQPIVLSIPEATTPQTVQKTPEATTIRLENDKKPALADRKVISPSKSFTEFFKSEIIPSKSSSSLSPHQLTSKLLLRPKQRS